VELAAARVGLFAVVALAGAAEVAPDVEGEGDWADVVLATVVVKAAGVAGDELVGAEQAVMPRPRTAGAKTITMRPRGLFMIVIFSRYLRVVPDGPS
jgi:hypothetical protein